MAQTTKGWVINDWNSGDVITEAALDRIEEMAAKGGNAILVSAEMPSDSDKDTNILWIKSNASAEEIDIPNMKDLENIIIDKYDETNPYSAGDYVLQPDSENVYKLYKNIVPISVGESWHANKWEQVQLGQIIENIINDLQIKTTKIQDISQSLTLELENLEKDGLGRLHAEFVNAGLYLGNLTFNAGTVNRAASEKKFVFPYAVTLTPDSGFRVGVQSFGTDGAAYVSNSGWQTSAYTVPAGTYFRVTIAKTDDSACKLCDLVNAVKVSTVMSGFHAEVENVASALVVANGAVSDMNWQSGGMYDATGIEYDMDTQCRSGFIAVDNTCNFRVVTDITIASKPQIFEFTGNQTTTSSVNVRTSKISHVFDKPVGVAATTKYIRIAFNEPLSNVQGHVYVVKVYGDSLKGYEADETASLAETGCGFLHGVFVNQGLWHGGLTGSAPWRVSCNKIFSFDHDITLTPLNGIEINIPYFNSSDEFTNDSGWQTTPINIPAGTRWKISSQGTTAAGYGDIILTLKNILVESVMHDRLAEVETLDDAVDALGVKAAASTVTNSASGAEVVITDGADGLALQALKLDFKPVQTGSGDPSPTNVRTITGLTGVTISRSGADTTDADETEVSWTGTIFGGQVDVTGGMLTETYREYTLDGTVTPTTISTSGNHIRFWVGLTGAKFYGGDPYCNQMRVGVYGTAEDYTWGFPAQYPTCLFAWLPYGVTGGVQEATAASIKAWLAEHPMQIVTTLATPATQSITPATITTVHGENHIWADGTTITECVYCADATITVDKLSRIPRNLPRHTYHGERFVTQYTYAVEKLFQLTDEYPIIGPDGKNRTRQGGACYGDYLFVAYNGFEHISVYQMSTGAHLDEIEISATYRDTAHAAIMSFGPERYNSADEFPLLYVSADANTGICEVYRIQRSGTTFSATLVQTINFPLLIDGLTANCFIDGENRKLWVEGHTTSSTAGGPNDKHRYARYELPWLSEGDVTISASDKQAGFDIPSYSAYQGGVVCAGKYMQAYGYGTSADLLQIDLLGGGVTGRVNLWDIGLTDEPESAFIWDGYLCFYTVYGLVYKLYFD